VHGGPEYSAPVIVDSNVLKKLEQYISLAPLHQPHNLAPIRVLLDRFPDLPQVGSPLTNPGITAARNQGSWSSAMPVSGRSRTASRCASRRCLQGPSFEHLIGASE
jgi:hypothetical protein